MMFAFVRLKVWSNSARFLISVLVLVVVRFARLRSFSVKSFYGYGSIQVSLPLTRRHR